MRFSTLALRSGSSRTLSRTEARATVAGWAAPPAREARRLLATGAGRAAIGGRHRSDLVPSRSRARPPGPGTGDRRAVVGRTASQLAGPGRGGIPTPGQPSGRAGRRPAQRRLVAPGRRGRADADAARIVRRRRRHRVGPRRFTPVGAAASVQPAAADVFWGASARLMIAGELRPCAPVIGARVSCESRLRMSITIYAVRTAAPAASSRRFASRRGVGIGVAWRL